MREPILWLGDATPDADVWNLMRWPGVVMLGGPTTLYLTGAKPVVVPRGWWICEDAEGTFAASRPPALASPSRSEPEGTDLDALRRIVNEAQPEPEDGLDEEGGEDPEPACVCPEGFHVGTEPPPEGCGVDEEDEPEDGEREGRGDKPPPGLRCLGCDSREATRYAYDRGGWGLALCGECQLDDEPRAPSTSREEGPCRCGHALDEHDGGGPDDPHHPTCEHSGCRCPGWEER